MVAIFPFQAVHYASGADLNRVIAPPYDQISSEMQEALYKRDPRNFVRLVFGKVFDQDSPSGNRYSRAADALRDWMNDGILAREERPAFFVYEQNFALKDGAEFTRLGLTALLGLEPLGQGVLPHEKTFSKPKEDRLNLMKACQANFEHVFFLVDDPRHEIRGRTANLRLSGPFLEGRDDSGTRHTLWMLSDSAAIAEIQDFFAPRKLLIADGHHRYETSLAYQKEMKDIWCSSTAGEGPFNLRLGTFVSLQDPGLVILPSHRVLRPISGDQTATLEKSLPRCFEVTELSTLEDLTEKLKSSRHAFGWVTKSRFRLLILKPSFDLNREFSDTAPALRLLDVVLLQKLIFEKTLAWPADRLDDFVSYVRWPEDALHLIHDGTHQAAFLVNPVKPPDVKVVAESGQTMPHKSTDFYPKLWSGFVFYKMDM